MRVIDFSPPMMGIEGEFNTFRLSGAWSKRIEAGSIVILMDKKLMSVMGYAKVTGVHVGKLSEMANQYAHLNHNQKHLPSEGAPDRLISAMIKRYGPHKCSENSRVTVIHLAIENVEQEKRNPIREI